mmetsp:Transcript_18425/g.39398  ORF Transcript_18425/g.39398 Transcript_18425/m.39398 type:complete len:718 (+) Transcript_18425:100-2253(+)|eukprot:CAMPEP_0206449302 /NCGR_PEP_ID=MMETSP0324_2-20121206/18007_1 /ASSEMBLY_ACC=CAM_ASM_000836 /TAXON_ID=2866 /ORGANISM="Crypthecodinium cohnii, Strain Seligo" /LENGTH=717 /DNA_ID=CAMNT_0053918651 /DNA_START=97 /DNA_END=2250 /DNA_ORIENTATION=+
MTTNHKLVCARAARLEFGEAFRRGIQDYRTARLAAATTGKLFSKQLPEGLPLYVLQMLVDEEVTNLAWEGSILQDNAGTTAQESPFRIMARKRPLRVSQRSCGTSGESSSSSTTSPTSASSSTDRSTPTQEEEEQTAEDLDLTSTTAKDASYDCISIEGKNNSVVVHDGRVHRDGRTLYMSHLRFCLDRIFSEHTDNRSVYAEVMPGLLEKARGGGRSTLMLFGQTGTGKTYTAQSLLDELVAELFATEGAEVSVQCYELAGSRGGREGVFDLLSDRKQVKCLTGEDGNVHVRGAKSVSCGTPEALKVALRDAFACRSSEQTERNEASSRSHAVIELHIPLPAATQKNDTTNNSSSPERQSQTSKVDGQQELVEDDATEGEAAPGAPAEGLLRIVDLAGSERNFETTQHTRKMAERGGHINYSLLMLKECARIMHRNRQREEEGDKKKTQHIPFRSSRLTHLLQACFTDPDHRTVVVTTLSPSPTDVEHSLNSLQHVGMMRSGRPAKVDKRSSTQAAGSSNNQERFSKVDGRGRGLHSNLQDARQAQLKLRVFSQVTGVGGSYMKKYEPENVKTEAFIDPRWHREMNVVVEEDLWVLKDADAEAVQLLTGWREEQWEARRSHDINRWDANAVSAFVRDLGLEDRIRLPSTMTGSQLCRLTAPKLSTLSQDREAGSILYEALQQERQRAREMDSSQAGRNAKIAALGNHRMAAATRAL